MQSHPSFHKRSTISRHDQACVHQQNPDVDNNLHFETSPANGVDFVWDYAPPPSVQVEKHLMEKNSSRRETTPSLVDGNINDGDINILSEEALLSLNTFFFGAILHCDYNRDFWPIPFLFYEYLIHMREGNPNGPDR